MNYDLDDILREMDERNRAKRKQEMCEKNKGGKRMNKKIIVVIAVSIAVLITLLMCITTVPTGHVGIKVRFGAVQNDVLVEGLNFKAPFTEHIVKMDCRTQRIDVDGEGASKDLQTVNTYIAINYSIQKDKAFELYKTVGTDYEKILIKPLAQESMKTTTAKYTAEELITKRAEVGNTLVETLKAKLEGKGIAIENASIVNLSFSDSYNDAIEKKQVAEQEAKKAEQELEKTKIEAEKKVVEAQADADAKIVKAKAEAEALKIQKQEITSDLLELRRIENQTKLIEKWNGQLPTTTLSDSVPMLNLSK